MTEVPEVPEVSGGAGVTGRAGAPGGPARLVVISGGVSDPSSTRMLADRIAAKSAELLRAAGTGVSVRVIELGPLAVDIAHATTGGFLNQRLRDAVTLLGEADAVIAATPVYKAGLSGLFKSFADLLDNDLLVAKPVVLAATAGSPRHSLVIDDQMRALFGYLRALSLPTSVFASPDEWASPELGRRVERAAVELAAAVRSGIAREITGQAWGHYQHEYGGNAAQPGHGTGDIDLSTDLMRLAAGGGLSPAASATG